MSIEERRLNFYKGSPEDNEPDAWVCSGCTGIVITSWDGIDLDSITEAQKDHICPRDLAKKRLRDDAARVEELLDELGVSIELHWSDYEGAELMLVDTKTRAERRLGTERLG